MEDYNSNNQYIENVSDKSSWKKYLIIGSIVFLFILIALIIILFIYSASNDKGILEDKVEETIDNPAGDAEAPEIPNEIVDSEQRDKGDIIEQEIVNVDNPAGEAEAPPISEGAIPSSEIEPEQEEDIGNPAGDAEPPEGTV